MDAKLALSLASSIDPKALASLRDRNHDPAVAKAVAAQFGSFLMQGMLQDSDGSALAMADGTGGPAVNAMFASAMSRYAMSGDKLGLADMIYRSTAGQSQAPAAAPSTNQTAPPGPGISLTPYRLGNGHRPFGPPLGRMTPPATLSGMPKTSASLAAAGAAQAPAAKPAQSLPAEHSFWDWLGVPSLLHLIFSWAELPNRPRPARHRCRRQPPPGSRQRRPAPRRQPLTACPGRIAGRRPARRAAIGRRPPTPRVSRKIWRPPSNRRRGGWACRRAFSWPRRRSRPAGAIRLSATISSALRPVRHGRAPPSRPTRTK
jgi:hypothetical protein